MNILYFDVEHGSQTLGSKETIQKNFNLPMLTPSSWDEFQATIGKIYKNESIKEKVKLGEGLEIDQVTTKVVAKEGLVVDALVIDTFSELSKKFMRTLTDRTGKMKLQEWGRLKNKLDTCLEFITRIPGNVICTCHSKTQTMDTGENRLQPYIDGSTKEDISKWFDFVFYTKTITDKDGNRKYIWITNRTETYDHAKDRTQLLDAEMDQDYSLVLEAAAKRGFDGSKILIIGSPGSGKTYSLKTLATNVVDEAIEDGGELADKDGETQTIHSSNGESMTESNGEIPVDNQVAYLRGETNNIQGGVE
tara:strand:+ start:5876 stop:6793 length:918 start_codon:yes stop_codon:yes gene_type:complete